MVRSISWSRPPSAGTGRPPGGRPASNVTSMWRFIRRLVGVVVVTAVVVVAWLLLSVEHVPSYPPPPGALSPAAARDLVARLAVAERVSTADLAVGLAPSTASAFQLSIDGQSFFPRILDDIRAARTSVHIAEYGVRPGTARRRAGANPPGQVTAGHPSSHGGRPIRQRSGLRVEGHVRPARGRWRPGGAERRGADRPRRAARRAIGGSTGDSTSWDASIIASCS